MIGVKGKQLCDTNHFQLSMHWDLDLWHYDPKINRAHPRFIGSLCVKCHDDKTFFSVKRKQLCTRTIWPNFAIFGYQCIVTLTFDHFTLTSLGHILESFWSLCMKFHEDRCKGKAIMQHKPFSVINALWPWPFDPKINRTHCRLMWSLCVKCHDDKTFFSVKRKQLCTRTIFYLTLPFFGYQCIVTLTLTVWQKKNPTRTHPWLIKSLCAKFHDDRCKGKAVL